MGDITIYNEPCQCKDYCAHFVEPMDRCVNRLSGEVVTKHCAVCGCIHWHQDGACLACKDKPTPPAGQDREDGRKG